MELNERDRKIYEFTVERIGQGCPPTVREICRELNIKSTSTVHRSLEKLVEEGYLEKQGTNLNRSVKLAGDSAMKVPVIGTVTAGQPITAIEDITGFISFTPNKNYSGKLFALKVKGESMINAAILDGDTVIVEQTQYAENGQIVVALVDNEEATVKRFYKEKGHYRLQPENDSMEPIISDSVSILGRVVAVYRSIE